MKNLVSILLAVFICLLADNSLFAQTNVTTASPGTVDYVPKWDGSYSITNSQIVDDGTNVGIGITVPEVKFQVINSASYSSPFSLPLRNHNLDEIFPGEIGAFVNSAPGGSANTSIGVLSIAQSAKECWGIAGVASAPGGGEDHGLKIGVFGSANADENNAEEETPGANVGVKGSVGGENSLNIGVTGVVETDAGNGSLNVGMSGSAIAEGGTMNVGVFGEASGGDQNVGVSGSAPLDANGFSYAGYFEGDVTIENYLGIGIAPVYPRSWLDVAGLTIIGEDVYDGSGLITEELLLSVDGGIAAKEVLVTQSGWADFVFKDGYELRSLDELKKFIAKHQHLPGVPSEEEVTKNGISLGKMDVLLLQKIEELTLYILEQDKRIQELEK